MPIPYAITPRPDTGYTNAQLGIRLFLAADFMLYGGLISAYVFLRTAAPQWPPGGLRLDSATGAVITVLLILSSAAVAWACGLGILPKIASGNLGKMPKPHAQATAVPAVSRRFLWIALALGALVLGIRTFEYYENLQRNLVPSLNTCVGIYYVLTGVHALHLLAGLAALLTLAAAFGGTMERDKNRMVGRIRVAGMYWHFQVLIWFPLFVLLYW